jgi:RimJ/RimL family protein N-acetyltransferase
MRHRVILQTRRLTLRELTEDDIDAFFALGSDPRVTRFTGTGTLRDRDHALQVLRDLPLHDYARHGFGRWATVLRATGGVIGFAGLKRLEELGEVDLGVWLLPEHWGAGLATEACQAVLAYGFDELGLRRIIGLVDPQNTASIRLLGRLGMRREGTVLYDGEIALRFVAEAAAGR